MPSSGRFGFGPFRLDTRAKRLLREGVPVPLAATDVAVLGALVTAAGAIVTKDHLMQAAWPDVTVGDNTLEKAIVRVRRALDPSDPVRYVETCRRAGYRFVAPVAALDAQQADLDYDALLAPHLALVEGRGALETLERERIAQARVTFDRLLAQHPHDATFHVGLANACALEFEATRADTKPDVDSLQLAVTHAREACRLSPSYGEAWATLGFVLERTGSPADAVAALRRATTIQPHNWLHLLRLSFGTWGTERLDAVQRTIAEAGECPLARVLAAMVYVARGVPDEARRELDAGLMDVDDDGSDAHAPFSVVALYWLSGLLHLARGDDAGAMRAFERELAREPLGHLYARECAAQTWYAIGACHLRRSDTAAAREAFEQAISRVPRHAMAHAGLTLLAPGGARTLPPHLPETMDLALARAVLLVAQDDTPGAVARVAAALDAAPPGNAGWLIPIEPLLDVPHAPDAWRSVLSRLRRRAL
jgi:DNA-binding winged helix-turn-helix (wHTH) protein/Tfp pilus assembly protein PilF